MYCLYSKLGNILNILKPWQEVKIGHFTHQIMKKNITHISLTIDISWICLWWHNKWILGFPENANWIPSIRSLLVFYLFMTGKLGISNVHWSVLHITELPRLAAVHYYHKSLIQIIWFFKNRRFYLRHVHSHVNINSKLGKS